MSRMLGIGFIVGDLATAVATFLNASGLFVGVIFAVLTSIALAGLSSSIRSILWPTYFWDPPEPGWVNERNNRSAVGHPAHTNFPKLELSNRSLQAPRRLQS